MKKEETTLNCPHCGKVVNLNKKLTKDQKEQNQKVNKMLKEMKLDKSMPPHIDYYCDCNAHLTIINGEIVTSSRW